jgi:iron complex outermembrane receptor protein
MIGFDHAFFRENQRGVTVMATTVFGGALMRRQALGAVFIALGSFAVPRAVFAQALEEIIVTAQKREESLQDVPVTVQAWTGEQLDNFDVTQVTDIVRLAPNLNVVVQNAMSQHIVIRGVGTNEFFGNAASSVGLYMDEVTMNSSYMSTLGLFDMERVEVLRGPQNSLFGRNTTGGAVNYISRLPQVGEEIEGYGTALYGSYDRLELEGAVSAPLGDNVALRVAAMLHDRDGRWNNVDSGDANYGDSERDSIRATLLFEPTDLTSITLSYHDARDRSQAHPQRAFGTLANNPPLRLLPDEQTIAGSFASDVDFTTNTGFVTSQAINPALTDWDNVRSGGSHKADLDVDGGYLKIVHDFEGATFTSITAFDNTHGLYEEDNGVSGNSAGPNTEALLINMDQDYEQVSQELRLASADDSASFRWIGGLYFFKQESTLGQNIRFGDNGVLAFHPIVNGVPPSVFGFPDTPAGFFQALDAIPNPFGNTLAFSIAELEDNSASIYGHTEFDMTDRATLTVGLRYTEDDISNASYFGGSIDITGMPPNTYYDTPTMRALSANLPACPPISPTQPPFTIGCASENTSRPDIETEEVGGKIGVDFRVGDGVMVYASFSRGFKSGKFDVEFLHTDATPFPQNSLDVEILDVVELGFKSDLNDGRMQLNGAVFFNYWEDQQVFNVGSSGPIFSNLPESEMQGLELELRLAPSDTSVISLALGLLDSEITDSSGLDFASGQGEFQLGHELPLAPEMTANAAFIKDVVIGANALTLQLDMHYQSESKAKYKPSAPIDEYESRLEVNASANYAFGDEQRYELGVFLENLTEEEYCYEKQDLHALVGAYYCVPNEGDMQFSVHGSVRF